MWTESKTLSAKSQKIERVNKERLEETIEEEKLYLRFTQTKI